MDSALQQEFDYYLAHQDELVRQYNGRYVVIQNREVVGDYDDEITAVKESVNQGRELGTFLVQKVEPGEDAYTQVFHSRVTFH